MPTIDLTDEEHAAVTAAVRPAIDDDRYQLSPRLAPLRGALAKLDPASVPKPTVERPPLPEAPARTRSISGIVMAHMASPHHPRQCPF